MNTSNKTNIYNMALAAIGVNRFVQSPEEGSIEANTCGKFWNAVVEQVLEEYPWGFAMRYETLQLISKTTPTWLYTYSYPDDCIRARAIVPYIDTPISNFFKYFRQKHIPFEIVENETSGGLAIATDIETPVLAYTARIMTIRLWSPAFVNAVTWLLASKIAAPLSAKPEYGEKAGEAYLTALVKAGASELNESREIPIPESEFIAARR